MGRAVSDTYSQGNADLNAAKLEALLRVSRALASEVRLESLLRVIGEQAADVLEAERCTVYLYDRATDELWSIVAQGLGSAELRFPAHEGLAGYAMRNQATLNIPDAYADARFNPAYDAQTGFRTRSVLSMPILSRENEPMGVVQLLNKAGGRTFSASDEALLEALCSHAALALERARLTEAYLEQQRLHAALELAEQIQRSMLPDDFSVSSDRVRLHAHLAPASVVGGDLYDYFLIGEDRLGFAVGDASGKGVAAALFMAGTQSLLRLVGQQGQPPERCFEDINRVQRNRAPTFITLFYGVLDLGTGRVEYCNAGHLPPVLLRSGGSVSPLERARNVPLGRIRNLKFRPGRVILGPGDLLFLYSDGVIEATDPQGEMFGEERLLTELAACPQRAPADVVRHIQTGVQRFCTGAPQRDDITMLALQYAG